MIFYNDGRPACFTRMYLSFKLNKRNAQALALSSHITPRTLDRILLCWSRIQSTSVYTGTFSIFSNKDSIIKFKKSEGDENTQKITTSKKMGNCIRTYVSNKQEQDVKSIRRCIIEKLIIPKKKCKPTSAKFI